MLELFPEGFEERDLPDGVELSAYTDGGGEERLWAAFGQVSTAAVPSGWEERWRTFHRPVRVGPLWVGPPWERPPPGAASVVIDPGRAFGTGGHPTTRLCLQLLLEVEPTSLLDVGCGSGVLAIAAARLGFAPVVAIDTDQSAIEAADRNARDNGATIDVRRGDALAVVSDLAPRLLASRLVASGYLESEQPVVAGYEPIRRMTEGGWAADLLARDE